MRNKRMFWIIGISILVIILVLILITMPRNSHISEETVSSRSNHDTKSTELESLYDITVPWIDYSTAPYKVDNNEISYEITMPIHTDKTKLDEQEKEMYLLNDYQENFYFGSKAFNNTHFSLVEIYPENRKEPFYFYEVRTYDKSFTDKGIIDNSSRVTIDQTMDLIWIDMRYGPNANNVRFFNIGDKPSISQIIDIPFTYDIYNNSYSKDSRNLLTYCTYDDNGDLIVKIVDIFNIDDFNYTINKGIMEFCIPKFLNDEEVYIQYETLEFEGRKLVKEIVNFKDNVTVYYKEEIIQ